MGDTPKQSPGNNKRKTFKCAPLHRLPSITRLGPCNNQMAIQNLLHFDGRSDNIRRLVQPGYLVVYFFSDGLQCFTRSLLKATCATLYGKRTAIYGKVYLAELVPVRPALLFEIHFRPRNVFIAPVQAYQLIPYRIHNLFCYAAMRHMKFYIHKFYFCMSIVCKQPAVQYVLPPLQMDVMFLSKSMR